jgi:hypothetical protein
LVEGLVDTACRREVLGVYKVWQDLSEELEWEVKKFIEEIHQAL